MRILWVKLGALWPLNAGGRIRTFNILKELAREHRVTLLTTHAPDEDPAESARRLSFCAEVVSLPLAVPKHGSLAFLRGLGASWLSPLPVDVHKWRRAGLRRAIRERLASGGVDLCVADFPNAAGNVPLGGAVPVVFFDHNVEYLVWQRLQRTEPRLHRRLALELEWRKMRRFEARTCARAQLTLAVSEPDRALLARTSPGARVRAIPTGVDTAYFTPQPGRERPGELVFTGSMDWYPNEDGILHFAENTLPLIRRQVPRTAVTVVGRDPSPRLRAAAERAGLRLTGTVEDVRPYVAESAVYVVPLRVGGGTRLKIFEALAMAKPVVSTTVGAEGLPLVPGRHFIQADEPTAFAGAVVSLLGDEPRRRALGGAGRELVEQRYAWPQVAREFEAACREVVCA
jgi:glycosyltransferase involved in cell wall biosynthesis